MKIIIIIIYIRTTFSKYIWFCNSLAEYIINHDVVLNENKNIIVYD